MDGDNNFGVSGITTALCGAAAVGLYAVKTIQDSRRNPSPPGPYPLPVVGNLLSLGTNPHVSLAKLAEKHGDIMCVYFGSEPVFVVSSADLAKQVLVTDGESFGNRCPDGNMNGPLITDGGKDIGFCDYGERLRRLRKLAATQLFTKRKMDEAEVYVTEECDEFARDVQAEFERGARHIHVREGLKRISMNSILRNMSGVRFSSSRHARHCDGDRSDEGERKKTRTPEEVGESSSAAQEAAISAANADVAFTHRYQKFLDDVIEILGVGSVWDTFPSVRWLCFGTKREMARLINERRSIFGGMVEERERLLAQENKEELRGDMLDALLAAERAGQLDRTEVELMMFELSLAGTDTNALTMEWFLLRMVDNPEAQAKVHEELDRVVGLERRVSVDDVANLPYLAACMNEALRMNPSAPLALPHTAAKEMQLAGYVVPKDTRVVVNLHAIHMSSKYHTNPEKFTPERFLTTAEDGSYQFDHDPTMPSKSQYTLLPFSAGRRGCAGQRLGYMTVMLAAARILHAFTWTFVEGEGLESIDFTPKFGLTVGPAREAQLRATPRDGVPPL